MNRWRENEMKEKGTWSGKELRELAIRLVDGEARANHASS